MAKIDDMTLSAFQDMARELMAIGFWEQNGRWLWVPANADLSKLLEDKP